MEDISALPDLALTPYPRPKRLRRLTTAEDAYLSLPELAAYTGLSQRLLRTYLQDPTRPLPSYRFGARVLVRRTEFDAWATQFRNAGGERVRKIVNDVLADVQDNVKHRA